MSSTATLTVLRLNFAEKAEYIKRACMMLENSDEKILKEVAKQTAAWVDSQILLLPGRRCDVVHMQGTGNHPYWNDKVRRTISDRLKGRKNSEGGPVLLRTDKEEY
jgi:hypothetical protein